MQNSTSPELALFLQICLGVIVLCVGMIALRAWKKNADKKNKK